MLVLEIMERLMKRPTNSRSVFWWILFTLVEPFVKLLIVFLCEYSPELSLDWNFELRLLFYSLHYLLSLISTFQLKYQSICVRDLYLCDIRCLNWPPGDISLLFSEFAYSIIPWIKKNVVFSLVYLFGKDFKWSM